MLDYEEVKRVYAEKLAADRTGRGRMEAAFYAAIRFAYEVGLADGTEAITAGIGNMRAERPVAGAPGFCGSGGKYAGGQREP